MKILIYNTVCQIQAGGQELLKCDIIEEIRNYLRVKKKGSYFARRHNKFAGNYKYFCTPNGKFMSGFLPYVYKYATETLGLDVELIDQRNNVRAMPESYEFHIGVWELYDHQKDALLACENYFEDMYWCRGIIDAATNAGKNSVIAGLHLNIGGRTIMLIHNSEIFEQAVEFFSKMFDVGQVRGNKMELDKPFVIAMYKTLNNRANKSRPVKQALSTFHNLIVDESHRASSADYARTVGWIDAAQRYFVSGTPLKMNDPVKKMAAIGLSGDVLYTIKNKDLIEMGKSLDVDVMIYKSTLSYEFADSYEQAYMDFVMMSEMRRGLIAEYLNEHNDRQVLIAVSRIEHGEYLMELLGPLFNARSVYGTTDDRTRLIDDFKKHKYRILVTTLLKEGVNAGIDTLIYAVGGKADISVLQYVGRVLRTLGNYDRAHVVDFFDNADYLDKHSRSRIRIYRKEGFKITYHYSANRFGTPQ